MLESPFIWWLSRCSSLYISLNPYLSQAKIINVHFITFYKYLFPGTDHRFLSIVCKYPIIISSSWPFFRMQTLLFMLKKTMRWRLSYLLSSSLSQEQHPKKHNKTSSKPGSIPMCSVFSSVFTSMFLSQMLEYAATSIAVPPGGGTPRRRRIRSPCVDACGSTRRSCQKRPCQGVSGFKNLTYPRYYPYLVFHPT